ncbi:MAG: LysE family transporter [Dongiaceae bacterium]
MTYLLPIFSIAGAIMIGAISPGPSFVLVLRTSVAVSRRAGLATALGMGIGGVIFGGLALLGLQAVIAKVGWLYLGLKIAGGAYLIYLAVRIWRGATAPLSVSVAAETTGASFGRSFLIGLVTQLSNPKAAVVYGSIFAALLPQQAPAWTFAVLLPLLFLVEAGWYSIVAVAFSSAKPRAVYMRAKTWIDRLAGSVIAALGIKLIVESARTH